MRTTFRMAVYGLLLLQLYACGSSRTVTITPQSLASTGRSLPALPVSQINIPIKVYMKPLLSMMDSSTAKEFTSDKWPDYTLSSCDFRYKYRFVRSPFVFTCVNNKVNIAFRGNYQIAGSRCACAFGKQVTPWISGSCGFGSEPLRRVDINISSVLNLLPNHQVLTATRLDKLQPLDKCEVTLMANDMTSEIMDSIKVSIESYATTFDNFVQSLNNSEQLRQWRSGGSRVMPISQYGFLNLNPTMLRIGKFNASRDTLYFSLGFSGSPQFSSDSQRLVTRSPLPPVTNTDNPGQISTYLNAVYEYKFFNKLLNDSLRNKPFELKGRTFVIKDVKVQGTNEGKLSVDIAFTGNRSGVLHLSGMPKLDTARQVLSMENLSFSVDTKDILVSILEGMFRRKVVKTIQNQAVLDIAALIQTNKAAIEARLNQQVTPWMSSAGQLQELKIVGLLPQQDHIQLQAYIRGQLVLIGHPSADLLGMQ
ncbi:MAG: DUF4403 family protein [Candidatus Pseudobacter hemicellulosilyticus]|uniref:DUF4403 family protein n=1 Tax=Candidatus Pseudobacter hemicellulosilyticus TaxID=3121375 RepID=A0AAJ5WTT6_9BACT|nr:MAG: DUF4403 family protein [Pseudobacter sp.]